MIAARKIRCAIYTRKSTTTGLEKDFNTLEAQREAASSYIASQKGNGWVELADQYDDGGFSGGTLERPALRRLLEDVKAGLIDIVVIYKLDRLSRSMSGVVRLVEVFEKHKTTFVSVTEGFNTTSAIGRVNLNVATSVAQYEREVGSERVRDKIAMSRQKGMWMGGMLPLGYDLVDKRLVVNKAEAAIVRAIFTGYQACPSPTALIAHLDAMGALTKLWLTKDNIQRGGDRFKKMVLLRILVNPVYVGVAVHKENRYPGQHEPIIDQWLFDAVQARFNESTAGEKSSRAVRPYAEGSLLRGLLFGIEGHAFVSTYSRKGSKEYRYYVNNLSIKRSVADCEVPRLPAAIVEQLVINETRAVLSDATVCEAAIGHTLKIYPEVTEEEVRRAMTSVDAVWSSMSASEHAAVLQEVIERIDVRVDALVIRWKSGAMGELLRRALNVPPARDSRIKQAMPDTIIALQTGPRRIQYRSTIVKRGEPVLDATMIRLIAKAEELNDLIEKRDYRRFEQVAEATKVNVSYVSRISRLAWLSPRIKKSIHAGEHPTSISAKALSIWDFPFCWVAQEKQFFSGELQ